MFDIVYELRRRPAMMQDIQVAFLPRVRWAQVGLCLIWGLLFVTFLGGQVRRVGLSIGEAEVLVVRGSVQLTPRNSTTQTGLSSLSVGARLAAGDRVEAGIDGYALLELVDGSTIEVLPRTELEILDFQGSLKELFRIWLGKVRLKIRKIVGAPNPYEMHSPIATIGVRGTEFEIEVRSNQVTTVRVYEGLVSVRNNQLHADEVLVRAGTEVTVYPLKPPDPPVTFEQVVAENFTRELSTEHPLLEKYLAFPDPHLDLAENPAYASQINRRSGRYYLFPARSGSLTSPEISLLSPLNKFVDLKELFATDERLLQGVSTRLSYIQPFDRWVIGGLYEYRGFDHDFRFRISRRIPTVFGPDVTVQQIGNSPYAPDLHSDSGSHRALFLAARRWAGRSIAISYDSMHSSGDIDTRYEFSPNGTLLSSERASTLFQTNQKRLSFGFHTQADSYGSLGLFYRIGFLDGAAAQTQHRLNQSTAPLAAFQSSGQTQEWGARWRKRLHRNLYLGVKSSLTRTDVEENVQRFRPADYAEGRLFWIPTLGAGLGFTWRDRWFASLDYQYSNIREQTLRSDLADGTRVASERNLRSNHAVHAWIQHHLPFGFFTGGGFTSFWASESFRGSYAFDSKGLRVDSKGRPRQANLFELSDLHLDQLGIGVGRRFPHHLFLEYQLSQTRGPEFRPLNHSFLLRLSF